MLKNLILTGMVLLLCSVCCQSQKDISEEQKKAYDVSYSLALSNWCGVFSGRYAIDPSLYTDENAVQLTGKSYDKANHIKLLNNSIQCKSNQNPNRPINALLASSFLTDEQEIILLSYAYLKFRNLGEFKKEFKESQKTLQSRLSKREFKRVISHLKRSADIKDYLETICLILNNLEEEFTIDYRAN